MSRLLNRIFLNNTLFNKNLTKNFYNTHSNKYIHLAQNNIINNVNMNDNKLLTSIHDNNVKNYKPILYKYYW